MFQRYLLAVLFLSAVEVGVTEAGVKYLRPLGASGAGQHLIIQSVASGTPAEQAGLLPADTLLEAGGITISDSRQLTEHLRGLNRRDSTALLVGRPFGRVTVRVLPDKKTRRLGVHFLGTALTDSVASLIAPSLTVSASVVEFGDGTLVRADVMNTCDQSIQFGPDSVVVIAGDGSLQSPITPENLLALKFGGSITDVAGMTHRTMGGAIASGIMSGWAQATREAYTRSVLENALRESSIPPQARHGGAVFYATKKMPRPVTVRIHISSRLFTIAFGDPSGSKR